MAWFGRKKKKTDNEQKKEEPETQFISYSNEVISNPDEMEVQEEPVEQEKEVKNLDDLPEYQEKENLDEPTESEHIITIDNFIQIRIYLPVVADIRLFKEKLEKVNRLLNSQEIQRLSLKKPEVSVWGK